MPSAASRAAHSGCDARLPSENKAILAGEPASIASLADSLTSRMSACEDQDQKRLQDDLVSIGSLHHELWQPLQS